VACQIFLHKVHEGDGFGDLGVGGYWGALSLGSFLFYFPPCIMLSQHEWVPIEVAWNWRSSRGRRD